MAPRHDEAKDRRTAHRAIAFSALGLALTGGIELVIAVYTGSVALLGDALHNLADVSTSAVVFVGFRVSRHEPTKAFPYGYERAEDLAGLGITLVIWASAVFAGYESYKKLVSQTGTEHLRVGMLAAIIGMVGNFAVARYKASAANRIQSLTLEAEAHHSWLDVISSLGALAGLIGVALGWRWADPVAGCVVTFFICHVGWDVTTRIVRHLMDGVDPEQIAAAEAAACRVPGVLSATARGRWLGRRLVLEIEGAVDPATPLARAVDLGGKVEEEIHRAVREARTVRWIPVLPSRASSDAEASSDNRARAPQVEV